MTQNDKVRQYEVIGEGTVPVNYLNEAGATQRPGPEEKNMKNEKKERKRKVTLGRALPTWQRKRKKSASRVRVREYIRIRNSEQTERSTYFPRNTARIVRLCHMCCLVPGTPGSLLPLF